MVKNESDIIESFCRYALSFCNQMLIFNDGSYDNTAEIINSLIKEGLEIILIDNEGSLGNNQFQITNELAAKAFDEYNADLILPIDADEFLYARDEENINPRLVLESLDENFEYRVRWINFLYYDTLLTDDSTFLPEFFPLHDEYIDTVTSQKTIVSRKMFVERKLKIAEGNHFLMGNRDFKILYNLFYAHYPFRSIAQTVSKVILRRINTILLTGTGFPAHWQKMYEKIEATGTLEGSDVTGLTIIEYMPWAAKETGTTVNTVPIFKNTGIELKYTDYSTIEKNCMSNIFSNYEQVISMLVRKLSEAKESGESLEK